MADDANTNSGGTPMDPSAQNAGATGGGAPQPVSGEDLGIQITPAAQQPVVQPVAPEPQPVQPVTPAEPQPVPPTMPATPVEFQKPAAQMPQDSLAAAAPSAPVTPAVNESDLGITVTPAPTNAPIENDLKDQQPVQVNIPQSAPAVPVTPHIDLSEEEAVQQMGQQMPAEEDDYSKMVVPSTPVSQPAPINFQAEPATPAATAPVPQAPVTPTAAAPVIPSTPVAPPQPVAPEPAAPPAAPTQTTPIPQVATPAAPTPAAPASPAPSVPPQTSGSGASDDSSSDDGASNDATSDDNVSPATVLPTEVVVDKNKPPEQYIKEVANKYIVPPLVREKFPDLIKLIYETESMNVEEREYWLQIMPIMTEDQIVKFRDILVNEKEQLAKLDNEYKQSMGPAAPAIDSEAMHKELEEIHRQEAASKVEDKEREAQLLEELENM